MGKNKKSEVGKLGRYNVVEVTGLSGATVYTGIFLFTSKEITKARLRASKAKRRLRKKVMKLTGKPAPSSANLIGLKHHVREAELAKKRKRKR